MEQIMTGGSAQKASSLSRAAAATVADIMRPPLTTVDQHDHVAAAAYLMKHAGTAALIVTDAQSGQPAASSPRQTWPMPSRTGKTSTMSGSVP